MLLVMQRPTRHPCRIITGVTDILVREDDFVWKRARWCYAQALDLDTIDHRYQFMYLLGEDTELFGIPGDCMIKWLVWNHWWIGDLIHSEASRHIQRNPVR